MISEPNDPSTAKADGADHWQKMDLSQNPAVGFASGPPSQEECVGVMISPRAVSPWTLHVFKDGSGSLKYGNFAWGASFPARTFAFAEVYGATTSLKPSEVKPRYSCMIRLIVRVESNDNSSTKGSADPIVYSLVTESGHEFIESLFEKADSLCTTYWQRSEVELNEFRRRTPIVPFNL
jgi:hypothetical protein